MNGPATGEQRLAVLDTELQDDREIEIYCWRMEELLRAGYAHVLADSLAADGQVDLHLACDLLARGCPQDLAYRIVS